jgi:hypothetical protein
MKTIRIKLREAIYGDNYILKIRLVGGVNEIYAVRDAVTKTLPVRK